jgi:hypothetical protein
MSRINRKGDYCHNAEKYMITIIYQVPTCHINSNNEGLSCGEKNL